MKKLAYALLAFLAFPAFALQGKGDPNVVHVVVFHGQSNVTGVNGRPLQTVSPRQPTKNFSFNLGPRIVQPDPADNTTEIMDLSLLSSIQPLKENCQTVLGGAVWCETAASGMLGRLTTMGVSNDLFALNIGRGGRTIDQLKQGTPYWAFGLAALGKLQTMYAAQGKTVVVTALVWSQGAGDRDMPEQEYYDKFVAVVQDFQADFKAVTGQTEPIRVLVLQDGSDGGGLLPDPPLLLGEAPEVNAQFQASMDFPDLIRIVAQQYPYEHTVDLLHLSGASQLRLGEHYALAYYNWVWRGYDWQPLRPTRFEIGPGSNQVRIYYTGNDTATVFDVAHVLNPGAQGFQLFNNGNPNSPIGIINAVNDPTNKRVTLSTLTNLNQVQNLYVAYAWNNGLTNPGLPGPLTGRRGTHRDNGGPLALYEGDGLLGLAGLPDLFNPQRLHKWMVRFKLPLNWTD